MKSWKIPAVVAAVMLVAGGGAVATAQSSSGVESVEQPASKSLDGYEIVTLPNAAVFNNETRAVRCPAGKRVVGGGGSLQGNRPVLVNSFPHVDGRGWSVSGRQDGADMIGVSVQAICVNP